MQSLVPLGIKEFLPYLVRCVPPSLLIFPPSLPITWGKMRCVSSPPTPHHPQWLLYFSTAAGELLKFGNEQWRSPNGTFFVTQSNGCCSQPFTSGGTTSGERLATRLVCRPAACAFPGSVGMQNLSLTSDLPNQNLGGHLPAPAQCVQSSNRWLELGPRPHYFLAYDLGQVPEFSHL